VGRPSPGLAAAGPERHDSGKVAVVGHTPQKNGEVLDRGYLKCIDTFCQGGGWLTALEVEGGRRVWQANEVGEWPEGQNATWEGRKVKNRPR
jgi:serine/threonine protein phosphatase 1